MHSNIHWKQHQVTIMLRNKNDFLGEKSRCDTLGWIKLYAMVAVFLPAVFLNSRAILLSTRKNAVIQKTAIDEPMHQVELFSYRSITNWKGFGANSNTRVLDHEDLVSRDKVVSIQVAHTKGLLHRAIWTAVLNPKREILMLRRASSLRTCPGEWGLVGEHSERRERFVDTAHRAMQEELQVNPDVSRIFNLIPNNDSVLVHTVYEDSHRIEAQATGLFVVFLDEEQQQHIVPDHEVSEWRWVTLSQLQTMHTCNHEITQLVAQRLMELGFTKAGSPVNGSI